MVFLMTASFMPNVWPMAAAIDAFFKLCVPGIFNFRFLSAKTAIFFPLPFCAICFENLLSGKKKTSGKNERGKVNDDAGFASPCERDGASTRNFSAEKYPWLAKTCGED